MSFRNILGTTLASFKISLGGPTIYQGSAAPVGGPFNVGDLYIRNGSGPGEFGLWIYDGAPDWFEVGTTFVGGSVTGDLDVSQQVRNGDPFIRVNAVDAGPGMTTGTAGVEVERNGTYANWEWNEANLWWEPTGASQSIHAGSGIALGDGTSGTPAIRFPSDPGNGIFYNLGSTRIGFATNASEQWYIDQGGVLGPAGTGRDLGTASIPVNRVYALTFRATPPGTTANTLYGFEGNNNTGMWSPATNEIGFSAGNTDVLRIENVGLRALDGTLAEPAYGFQSISGYGMYVDAGVLKIAAGAERLIFGGSHTEFGVFPIQAYAGSEASPGVQVGSSGTQGLYRIADDTLGIAVAGSITALTVNPSGLLSVDPAVAYETLVSGDDDIPNKKWIEDNVLSVAGANMEIQYNVSGTSFGASADFTWNVGSTTLTLDASSLALATIAAGNDLTIVSGVGTTPGSNLNLNAGPSGNTTNGGNLIVSAGAAGSGVSNGGALNLSGGSGLTGTEGGDVSVSGGSGGTGPSGDITIAGGDGGTAGGNVTISGGDAGGNVTLRPGTTSGVIQLLPKSGESAPALEFHEDDGGAGNSVTLKAPTTVTTSRTWVLPQDAPGSAVVGNILTSDVGGAGVLSLGNPGNGNYPVAPSYTLAGPGLPPPATPGGFIFVADGTPAAGPPASGTLAFSNGAAWIDVTTSLPVV